MVDRWICDRQSCRVVLRVRGLDVLFDIVASVLFIDPYHTCRVRGFVYFCWLVVCWYVDYFVDVLVGLLVGLLVSRLICTYSGCNYIPVHE